MSRLRELDPALADWWVVRRAQAWREVGLVRPHTAAEQAEYFDVSSRRMNVNAISVELAFDGVRKASKQFQRMAAALGVARDD